MFVDSHCHIDFPELLEAGDALFQRMNEARVSHAMCISVNLENFPRVLKVATDHDNIFASVGVHPEHTEGEEPSVERLYELSQHAKVIAIGETGLDYYWHKDKPEWQRERFRTHIRAARKCNKPLIIHTREAAEDTLRIMREENAEQARGVMHCFTESLDVAQAAIELGFYISFSGIVTFKNAVQIKEVAQKIPLNRLLIETDSPYLAPVPFRGKTNEPSFVPHVATEVAKLRGITVEEVAYASTQNFFKLFSHATQA